MRFGIVYVVLFLKLIFCFANEETLVLVKPDGVRRGLVGEIIRRFELRGLLINDLKMMRPSRELIEKHYEAHAGKDFFDRLVNDMTGQQVVALSLTAPRAVEVVRKMVGATNPVDASVGTIRGDLGLVIEKNVVHASDSLTAAARELDLWFGKSICIN